LSCAATPSMLKALSRIDTKILVGFITQIPRSAHPGHAAPDF
jgi:hypothetical protein